MGSEQVNRSRPFAGRTRAIGWVSILVFVGYVVGSHMKWHLAKDTLLLEGFFAATALLVLLFMISGLYWRSFTHLAPASGRVLAIVPCYNEESHLVHAVVRSLLRQSILPDEIHVVDDGSPPPRSLRGFAAVTPQPSPNEGKQVPQARRRRQIPPPRRGCLYARGAVPPQRQECLQRQSQHMKHERRP